MTAHHLGGIEMAEFAAERGRPRRRCDRSPRRWPPVSRATSTRCSSCSTHRKETVWSGRAVGRRAPPARTLRWGDGGQASRDNLGRRRGAAARGLRQRTRRRHAPGAADRDRRPDDDADARDRRPRTSDHGATDGCRPATDDDGDRAGHDRTDRRSRQPDRLRRREDPARLRRLHRRGADRHRGLLDAGLSRGLRRCRSRRSPERSTPAIPSARARSRPATARARRRTATSTSTPRSTASSGDFMVYDDAPAGMLGQMASSFGESVLGVVFAHEFGHAVQSRAGVLRARAADDRHRTAGRLLRRRVGGLGQPGRRHARLQRR